MTSIQQSILDLLIITPCRHKDITRHVCASDADASRILFGLRAMGLVRQDKITHRWHLTSQGIKYVQSQFQRDQDKRDGDGARRLKVGEYRPFHVRASHLLSDGSLHIHLDRRMNGKSMFIKEKEILLAYQEAVMAPEGMQKSFVPSRIQRRGDGWLLFAEVRKNGRHVFLEPGQLRTIGGLSHPMAAWDDWHETTAA